MSPAGDRIVDPVTGLELECVGTLPSEEFCAFLRDSGRAPSLDHGDCTICAAPRAKAFDSDGCSCRAHPVCPGLPGCESTGGLRA